MSRCLKRCVLACVSMMRFSVFMMLLVDDLHRAAGDVFALQAEFLRSGITQNLCAASAATARSRVSTAAAAPEEAEHTLASLQRDPLGDGYGLACAVWRELRALDDDTIKSKATDRPRHNR